MTFAPMGNAAMLRSHSSLTSRCEALPQALARLWFTASLWMSVAVV